MMRASEKTRVLQKIAFQQGVRIFHSSPYSFSGHFELGIGQCLIFRSYFTSDEFEFLHQLKIDIREQLKVAISEANQKVPKFSQTLFLIVRCLKKMSMTL